MAEGDKRKRFETLSGLPIKPVYGPGDVPGDVKAEAPGEYPFTRGIHPEMYRRRLWTMRQYSGYGTAEETNSRYRFLLEEGNTGLSMPQAANPTLLLKR